ncbi:Phosphatidate cytidylyltransferase [Serratia symbiotica]|nr:Phosphatidate cytidylyltransferase [Serratia symbiotica]
MLKYRFITTIILIPLVIIILFLFPPIIFSLITLIICTLAFWEWCQFLNFTSYLQRTCLIILFISVLIFITFNVFFYKKSFNLFLIKGCIYLSLIWWINVIFLILFYPYSVKFWKNSYFLRIFFGLLTIIPFFSSMLLLRLFNYQENHLIGSWYLIYIMLIVWSIDSGSYIFGKLFGKYLLIPKVSPNKTWEGLIGGLITSIIIILLFNKYLFVNKISINFITHILIIYFSIIGDLSESMFKRESGIKNSSNIIPGHGGILDRIDSLTAVISISAFFILL